MPGTGFVFGIQADYDWTDANASHVDPATLAGHPRFQDQVARLRDRPHRLCLGPILAYVKGGGAWERDDYGWFVTALPALGISASETRGGWTVGIGAEYAFTDWISGFVEYDYYDFGPGRSLSRLTW